MLKIRMKREAEHNADAMKRLMQIETSIIEPRDEAYSILPTFLGGSPRRLSRSMLLLRWPGAKISL
jgi:hypothetical protein